MTNAIVRISSILKFTLIVSLLIFISGRVYAQEKGTLRGLVEDTSLKARLCGATVCLLKATDSTLLSFLYTSSSGTFNFKSPGTGQYIILVSLPDYADYVQKFSVDEASPGFDFKKIAILSKAKMLEEVIVKAKPTAIVMKGDTTEFSAKAYVIQPNDKVEDLLKQISMIQVDQNGKITAQGKEVQKILLDGEEFFGDDPTLVTKNIRADMVDKVQLYDGRSDKSKFTGIDDGARIKTLNVKLKEDKKDGTFGKIAASVGSKGYYEGQAIYNRFTAKAKYSAYLTAANDGKTGLVGADISRIGFSNTRSSGTGLVNVSASADALDSYNGVYNGKGIPEVRNAGFHFDNKSISAKNSNNSNLQIGSVQVTGSNSLISQQTLPNEEITTLSSDNFDNRSIRKKGNTQFQFKLDSTVELRLNANLEINDFESENNFFTNNTNSRGKIINYQSRSLTNKGRQDLFEATSTIMKKFRKLRKTFAWDIGVFSNGSASKGYLFSRANYFGDSGAQDSIGLIDQFKRSNISNKTLTSDFVLTEPLSTRYTLTLNYGLALSQSLANRSSYNTSTPKVYDLLDSIFSNNYKFAQLSNQLGLLLAYNHSKTIFNVGSKFSLLNFNQRDLNTTNNFKREFLNSSLQAYYRYAFTQNRSFWFFYTANSNQPSIEQLQPIRVNTDPLNLLIGNAGLKPSFSNNFEATYQFNNIARARAAYIGGRYSLTARALAYNVQTDILSARTEIIYTNLTSNIPSTYSLYVDYVQTFAGKDIKFTLNVSTRGSTGFTFSNGALLKSETAGQFLTLGLSKAKKDAYSFMFSVSPNYTSYKFSLFPESDNSSFGLTSTANFRLFFSRNYQFYSTAALLYTAKTKKFDAQNRILWNSTISRSILPNKSLNVSLSVNDLLNQNRIYSRSVVANSIIQSESSVIKRYLLASVSWDFTRFKTSKQP